MYLTKTLGYCSINQTAETKSVLQNLFNRKEKNHENYKHRGITTTKWK